MSGSMDVKNFIGGLQDVERFHSLNWSGGFQDYINLVKEKPEITNYV